MEEELYLHEHSITVEKVKTSTITDNILLTNGIVLGLVKLTKSTNLTMSDILQYLRNPCNLGRFRTKIHRLQVQRSKKTGKYLKLLLAQRFLIPEERTPTPPVSAQATTKVERDPIEYASTSWTSVKQSTGRKDYDTVMTERRQLKKRVTKLEDVISRKKERIQYWKTKFGTSQRLPKKLKQRKDLRTVVTVDEGTQNLKKQIKELKTNLASKNIDEKALRDSCSTVTLLGNNIEEKEKEISKLKETNQQLISNSEYLQSLIEDSNATQLELFDAEDRSFTTGTELCIYGLLDNNVSMEKVPKVIEEVARLCGKRSIDRLPSEATVRNMNKRRLSVSHLQAAELTTSENLCLLSDETPDRGATVEGFHVSDETGRVFVLGLREMSNKSAVTTLDTFKEILSDISLTAEKDTASTECGKKIISQISSTMSDQAATQKCFNDLLRDYKKEILPDVLTSWEDMTPAEQSSCSTINNFFCGLHLLINFAETANQVLKKYESASENLASGSKKAKPGESGTVNFIRITCKALGKRGDAKSGAHTLFRDYIYSKLGENLFLEPFHGNRFNILFVNAGSIYFYREEIQDFLENSIKDRNQLLQAVLDAVKVHEYVAAAKALGLIEKLITSPLWRIIESRCHILEMNKHYSNLLEFLEAASKDSIPFLNGKHMPFGSFVVVTSGLESQTVQQESSDPSSTTTSHRSSKMRREDAVWANLFAESPYDDKVVEILQMIFTAWAIYLKRAVKSHLPGGEFSNPSEELREKTMGVPKHNKFSEAVFGILHNLTTMRPNASTLANEAYIVFSLNQTLEWINSKSETERASLVKKARKLTKAMQQRFKTRKDTIKRKRQEALTKQREEIARQRQRELQEKERLTNEIIYHGLWQTEEEVHNKAKSYKNKKEWQRAFQSQFKFRKIVLQQQYEDKSIFNLSKNRRDLSFQELTANLIKLIGSTFSPKSEEQVVQKGNPLLVGKNVMHTFEEEGEKVSYQGKVIDTVRGFPEWYNVKYDGDDGIYTYKLQEDYEKGDLKLVVDSTLQTPGPSSRK